MPDAVRITIRVHPGASRPKLAAEERTGADGDPVLGVWVSQRAVDGQANEAVLAALAKALGTRKRALRLVTGVRSRVKIVEVSEPPPDLPRRLAELAGGSG